MAKDKEKTVDIMSRVRRVGQAVQDLRLKQKRFVLNTAIQALDLEEEDEAIRAQASFGSEQPSAEEPIAADTTEAVAAPRRGKQRFNADESAAVAN